MLLSCDLCMILYTAVKEYKQRKQISLLLMPLLADGETDANWLQLDPHDDCQFIKRADGETKLNVDNCSSPSNDKKSCH